MSIGRAMQPEFLISIVVPTMNSASTVGATMDSLAHQVFRAFEVIVCDGESRDATLSEIHRRTGELPVLRVDSRRDDGVYDAINRGVAMSRGQWLLVLGSDDRLHAADTLAKAAQHLEHSEADLVYGDVLMMAKLGDTPAGSRYAGPMALNDLLLRNICQQAIFYRRTVFEQLGRFDLRYKIWADWDFNLRVAFRRPIQWIDLIVSDYSASGMSTHGGDVVFERDAWDRLLDELRMLPLQRQLWPLQRRLLRHADELRRRGLWREALRYFSAYLALRCQRLGRRVQTK